MLYIYRCCSPDHMSGVPDASRLVLKMWAPQGQGQLVLHKLKPGMLQPPMSGGFNPEKYFNGT